MLLIHSIQQEPLEKSVLESQCLRKTLKLLEGTFKIESEVGKGTHVTGEFIKKSFGYATNGKYC